jgi:hypothetical protein
LLDANATAAAESPTPRRWLRFSLRTFLIATAILSIVLAWCSNIILHTRNQRAVVARLRAAEGRAYYDQGLFLEPAPGPWFGRFLFGQDAYAHITTVNFDTVEDDEVVALLKRLPKLRKLSLGRRHVTDATLAHLLQMPQLEELELGSTSVTPTGLSQLQKLPRLQTLSLSDNMGDAIFEGLPALTNVRVLSLNHMQITAAGLKSIGEMTNLRKLEFFAQPQFDEAALHHLSRLHQLEEFDISRVAISSRGLAHLTQLRSLQKISISWAPNFGDNDVAILEKFPGLRQLRLGRTQITDAAIPEIASLSALTELDLYEAAITDEGIAQLAGRLDLQKLRLGGTKVTNASAPHFASFSNLKELDIGRTEVDIEGLRQLTQLKSLKRLHVGPWVTYLDVEELRLALPRCQITPDDWNSKGRPKSVPRNAP